MQTPPKVSAKGWNFWIVLYKSHILLKTNPFTGIFHEFCYVFKFLSCRYSYFQWTACSGYLWSHYAICHFEPLYWNMFIYVWFIYFSVSFNGYLFRGLVPITPYFMKNPPLRPIPSLFFKFWPITFPDTHTPHTPYSFWCLVSVTEWVITPHLLYGFTIWVLLNDILRIYTYRALVH